MSRTSEALEKANQQLQKENQQLQEDMKLLERLNHINRVLEKELTSAVVSKNPYYSLPNFYFLGDGRTLQNPRTEEQSNVLKEIVQKLKTLEEKYRRGDYSAFPNISLPNTVYLQKLLKDAEKMRAQRGGRRKRTTT